MAKVLVELDSDYFHELIVKDLIESYNTQVEERDAEKRIIVNHGWDDARKDVARVNYKASKKFVKALRNTLKYYTTLDERIELGLDF